MTNIIKETTSLPILMPHENPAKTFFGRLWSWMTSGSLSKKDRSTTAQSTPPPPLSETARKIVTVAKERISSREKSMEALKKSCRESCFAPIDSLRIKWRNLTTPKTERENLAKEIGLIIANTFPIRLKKTDYTALKESINCALIQDSSATLSRHINSYVSERTSEARNGKRLTNTGWSEQLNSAIKIANEFNQLSANFSPEELKEWDNQRKQLSEQIKTRIERATSATDSESVKKAQESIVINLKKIGAILDPQDPDFKSPITEEKAKA